MGFPADRRIACEASPDSDRSLALDRYPHVASGDDGEPGATTLDAVLISGVHQWLTIRSGTFIFWLLKLPTGL
jgi:hypothetical protein